MSKNWISKTYIEEFNAYEELKRLTRTYPDIKISCTERHSSMVMETFEADFVNIRIEFLNDATEAEFIMKELE